MLALARRTLRDVAIFRGLNAASLSRWEALCKWRTFAAQECILEADDQTCDIFFLIEGKVQVVMYSAGGQVVLFRDITAGGMFGEFAAIDGKQRSASVEAIEPCLVACMTANNFRKQLKRDNAVVMALLEHTVTQMRVLTSRVFEFSTLAVNHRIQAELVRLAQKGSAMEGKGKRKEVRIDPFPRHLDIANRVSTHREAVTRELANLKKLGIVARDGKALVILDLERLMRKAGEADR
jgi:CRP/FNR family transcriptional regulator, cyclic AMP receptor protein